MEKSVWLWLRSYWQVVATSVVVVWFLLATLTGTEKGQLAANRSDIVANSAPSTLATSPEQALGATQTTIAVLATTTTSPAVAMPPPYAPGRASGTNGQGSTSGAGNTSSGGSNGNRESGYLYVPRSGNSNTLSDGRITSGDLAFKVKSAEAHPVDKPTGPWEVNAIVEVTNLSNANKQFNPSRITARIGNGVAAYRSKPIVVDVSPQVPVLVPLEFETSSLPSSNFALSYNGIVLSRGIASNMVTAR